MPEDKVYTAIGMMSGTSLDGIDVARVRTDGKDFCELDTFECYEYDEETRKTIRKALGKSEATEETAQAEKNITKAHILAINKFNKRADVIGFHGHTIIHDPAKRFTWQIGNSQEIADKTGIDVVGDMRQTDIEAGGQGAPLLPLCHRALAKDIEKPIAILNLGGVGNITYLGKNRADILAFDTGPANALMDDVVKEKTGKSFDYDGTFATAGSVNDNILNEYLSHPYFEQTPPKSLDRNEWDISQIYSLKLEDAIATLAMFTVKSIQKSMKFLPESPRAIYVTGGGRRNKFIMRELNTILEQRVEPVETIGWNGDGLEAQGFAYLAVRSLKGLALTLPETTGISEPTIGGVLYKPQSLIRKQA